MQIVRRYMKLQSFTLSYFQANVVVPYILTGALLLRRQDLARPDAADRRRLHARRGAR